jgi:hypothetical protein
MPAMSRDLGDKPVGEVLLGESWLFIFVAHKIWSFTGSLVPFALLCVLCGKSFGFSLVFLRALCGCALFFLISAHLRVNLSALGSPDHQITAIIRSHLIRAHPRKSAVNFRCSRLRRFRR